VHFSPRIDHYKQCVLVKDREQLLTFYDFPTEHCKRIHTSNPIESTFATVRQRTVKTKNCLGRETTLVMAS
jgi:putative transposase